MFNNDDSLSGQAIDFLMMAALVLALVVSAVVLIDWISPDSLRDLLAGLHLRQRLLR